MSHSEERALAGEGTTLITPTVRQDNHFGRKAVEIYRRAMCRDNDRPQRVKLLSEALEYANEFREAYFWRGILNFVDVQLNINDLKRALNLTSINTCQYLVIQSQICAMSRNPEKAVIILTNALKLAQNDGDLGEVYYFRAFANWWIDRDEAAFEDCQKAIQNNYNVKSSYTHLADMARYMNKPHDEIREYYELSLLPTPCYTELVKYGIYLKKKNLREEALSLFEEAIQKNSYSPDAYEERASITYDEKDYIIALQLDTHAKLIQCRRMYAAVLADRKLQTSIAKSIQVLTDGIKMKPRAEWYCLRGQLRIEFSTNESDRLRGCRDLRKAVQLNPSEQELQYWLCRAIHRVQGATLTSQESTQRGRNTIHLAPNYTRINQEEALRLKSYVELPCFKFYGKEAEGLYKYSKRGAAYQYAVTTRKVVCLLADFATEKEVLMFKVFKRYAEQLYMWLESSKLPVVAAAERSLRHLWSQNIPDHVLQIMKKIQIMEQLSSKNFVSRVNRKCSVHEMILFADCPEEELTLHKIVTGNYGEEILQVYLHYLYRKPISISKAQLPNIIEFSKDIGDNQLEQFLNQVLPEYPIVPKISKKNKNEENGEKKVKYIVLDFNTIFKDLSQFVDDASFSDIVFLFKEKKQIWGNRLLLSANCPYFSRMLNNGLKESKESEIAINVSYDIWRQVMVYCYGGIVELTPENCIELLQVSDEFGLPKLKILCELYIGQSMDFENLFEIESIAIIYNATRLQKYCQHLKTQKNHPCDQAPAAFGESFCEIVDKI